jgi:hypothetical protein
VIDRVDTTKEIRNQIAVADVAFVEVDVGTEVRGGLVPMDRRHQRVEDHDVVSQLQ